MKNGFAALCLTLVIAGPVLAFADGTAATQPSKQAAERAKQLKANVKSFTLMLDYHGDQDKPFYRLCLSVPAIPAMDTNDTFFLAVKIDEDQAVKLIDQLALDGFLDNAKADNAGDKAEGPCYVLTIQPELKPGGLVTWQEDLGWGLAMLKRLDGLQKVLQGPAAEKMALLVGRLYGLRKQWESRESAPAAPPAVPATRVQAMVRWPHATRTTTSFSRRRPILSLAVSKSN